MNKFAKGSYAAGFSLVEIMVAMVIGLLGMLVIFQVFSVSEGYRRTTTGGGDAQQNGAVGLYVLAKELRQAGWGFNNSAAIGCQVVAYDSNQGGVLAPYTLTPVAITLGPANGSDMVEINYGNQFASATPTPLTTDQAAATDAFTVKYPYGYAQDDLVLLVEAGQSCTLAQLTSLGTGALSTTFYHDPGASNSRYNKPGGSGVVYSHNAWMYNMGARPSRNVYSISNGTLTVLSAIASGAQETVADGIVQMKAQYGKDNGLSNGTVTLTTYAAGDGVVDRFDSVTPLTTSDWSQVLAIRIGVVARSAQPEKPKTAGGACDATTGAPTWAGGSFDLSADPSWQCYRYKVFQTTVPIRNMLWSQG